MSITVEDAVMGHLGTRYGGRPCPHCGVTIIKEDAKDIIFSAGGTFLQEYGVAAHGTCFYKHEATDDWKLAHPQYSASQI